MKRKWAVKIGDLRPQDPAKQDLKAVKRIYEKVESKPERYELNLYISGEDEEEQTPVGVGAAESSSEASEASA